MTLASGKRKKNEAFPNHYKTGGIRKSLHTEVRHQESGKYRTVVRGAVRRAGQDEVRGSYCPI